MNYLGDIKMNGNTFAIVEMTKEEEPDLQGLCDFDHNVIYVRQATVHGEEVVHNTLLHELAHASLYHSGQDYANEGLIQAVASGIQQILGSDLALELLGLERIENEIKDEEDECQHQPLSGE